ncbi:hypothetical protein [Bdellovibrio bacteriovorus]|uniref:hypothetical protein n=1 Tax=Bdellovibrio TaxID=958 RepID=UPI0035A875D0
MLNVSAKYFITILLSAVLLTSCKEPELDVGSLGKKLPAPALKGTSPFNQDFDSQSYARVQGSCDARVGNIFVSFDKSVWHQPPVNPDISGTSLPVGTTNDRDCTDGSFDIYLTKNDLQNIWGIQTGNNGSHVDYLYIKGESMIGDTETLTLVDNNSGTSPGSNNSPVKIILEKTWPRGFAGSGICESFRVAVLNSSGYRVTTPTAITFSLEKRAGGTVSGSVYAYTNWQECNTGPASTQKSFTIPAGSDGMDLIYKFPDAPLDSAFDFRITNPSSLVADTNYTSVILRDSSSNSNYRWLATEEPIHQIYKGVCYPLKIRAYQYNHGYANDTYSNSFNFTSTESQVKFYEDSSCGAELSTYTLAPYSSTITAYVKYNPSASDTTSYKEFSVSIASATAGSLTYDSSPIPLRADLSTKSSVTHVDIWGPRILSHDTCYSFRVVSMNANGTQLPVSAATNIQLATLEANVGTFYSEPSCTSGVISNVSIAAQSSSMVIYFKPNAATIGTYHFSLTSSGLIAPSRELVVE